MVDVKGRWALITGASRGIGYLAAKFMAEKGCNLILQARKTGDGFFRSGKAVFFFRK